jgi:hypothetical protein
MRNLGALHRSLKGRTERIGFQQPAIVATTDEQLFA